MSNQRTSSEAGQFRKISETPDSDELLINVLFTDEVGTRAALERAVDLTIDLDAVTRVIVPHVVPYPLPLDEPTVPLDFTCRQIRCIAGAAGADPYVDVYLCRDRLDLLKKILPPLSIVVIGAHKGWLPTRAERIARSLQKQGCDVLLARYA